MASYEDVDFSTLDSFHKYFYDDSVCNNGVVLSRKLPPDKVKVRLLATTTYLMTLIICILIPTTNYNGIPVLCLSSAKAELRRYQQVTSSRILLCYEILMSMMSIRRCYQVIISVPHLDVATTSMCFPLHITLVTLM